MCTDSHSRSATNDMIAASQCRCTSARMSSGTLESTIKLLRLHLSDSSTCSWSRGRLAVRIILLRPGVLILLKDAGDAITTVKVCVFVIISCGASLLRKRSGWIDLLVLRILLSHHENLDGGRLHPLFVPIVHKLIRCLLDRIRVFYLHLWDKPSLHLLSWMHQLL